MSNDKLKQVQRQLEEMVFKMETTDPKLQKYRDWEYRQLIAISILGTLMAEVARRLPPPLDDER